MENSQGSRKPLGEKLTNAKQAKRRSFTWIDCDYFNQSSKENPGHPQTPWHKYCYGLISSLARLRCSKHSFCLRLHTFLPLPVQILITSGDYALHNGLGIQILEAMVLDDFQNVRNVFVTMILSR